MGEETDIVEPMSSEDVGAAEDLTANEPSKDHPRKRKKHLYKSLKELLEFYLGDVNISKDRFIQQSIQGQPFVYMDLTTFLKFNKVRALTSNIEDLQKAIDKSEILQLSEDKTQVCRKTPILRKENEDECTIYVEQLGPDMEHDVLIKMFSKYGDIDYVSLPRFSHNGKCKGFAFVEFKEPEFAKKALEAFNAKGCCLSPQMAPEDLLSIKHYDPKPENKKGNEGKKREQHNVEEVNEIKEDSNENNNIDENVDKIIASTDTSDSLKKEKKKRKYSNELVTVPSKKLKYDISQVDEINEDDNCSEATVETNESNNVVSNKKTNDKCNQDITKAQSDSNETKDSKVHEKEDERKRRKRKYSEGMGGPSAENSNNELEDGEEKIQKLDESVLKSDTEVETEHESSQTEEDGQNKQKKKRKGKKKLKKNSSAISMGLKILSKREWKQLRNKYLNMQKKTMRTLKQHLSYSKWEKNKLEEKATKLDNVKPGTVIKVTLENPIVDCKTAKNEMRVHPEIRYVDVTEGEVFVYLRTSTPELAATLLQTKHWPNMEIITGAEETEYFEKMKKDREKHFNKDKQNQRGRTKLLKKAERYL